MAAHSFLARRSLQGLATFAAGTGYALRRQDEEGSVRLSSTAMTSYASKRNHVSPFTHPATSSAPSLLKHNHQLDVRATHHTRPWFGHSLDRIKLPNSLFNDNVAFCDAPAVHEELATVTYLEVEPTSREEDPTESEPTTVTTTTAPIPEWKQQFSSIDLDTPFLERQEIVTKTETWTFPWLVKTETEHVSEVYILGTLHGTKQSAERVKSLLEAVSPDTVFIELCEERADVLTCPPIDKNMSFPWMRAVQNVYNEGLSFEHSAMLVFMAYAQHLLAKHGAGHGGEFRAGYDYIMSQESCERPFLILGDRRESFTLARLADIGKPSSGSRSLRAPEQLYGNKPLRMEDVKELERQAEEVLDKAVAREAISVRFLYFLLNGILDNYARMTSDSNWDMQFPEESRIGLQERDVYMVSKLIQWCRMAKPKQVVVIVGALHVRGMTHLLDANIIGTDVEPKEVLSQIVASEKYPEDDALVQGLVSGVTIELPLQCILREG